MTGDAPQVASQSGTAIRLKLTEIFSSLQGESSLAGMPTVFVRLTGCPLRCQFCDTAYAFHGGTWQTVDEILQDIRTRKIKRVCVTGGEPLAQKNVHALMTSLCDEGYQVSIETSGALDVSDIDPRVIRVIDIKTPGSAEVDKNLWRNFENVRSTDQLKFVICDRADYEWAKAQLPKLKVERSEQILFSPSHQQITATELADWIVADALDVKFQTQLHKILWGGEAGR